MAAPTATALLADESTLVAALRQGDPGAREKFVRQNLGRVLQVARRIVGNDSDAEDVVQEAFLSAFRSLDRFDGKSLLSTWLHRITINAALMLLRTRRRHPEISIEPLLPQYLSDGHRVDPARGWAESAGDLAERQEIRQMLRLQINELPELYREVVLLRDIEELTTEETAELLGVSTSVVKTRLHRARQALRQIIENRLLSRGDRA